MKIRRLAVTSVLLFIIGCAGTENPKSEARNPKQIPNPKSETQNSELETRITVLIKQLDDNKPQVRERATDELIEIGKPAVTYLLEALKQIKGKNAEVEWRLRFIVRTNDIKERVQFSRKLTDAFPDIYRDLAKDSGQNKMRVLRQIIERGKSDATDDDVAGIIGEILSDGGKGLSTNQKSAICSLSEGIEFHNESLNERDGWDNLGSGETTFIRWDDKIPSAVPHLKKLLKDDDFTVRHTAARTICEISTDASELSDVVPAVVELLNDSSPDVQKLARNTISKIPAKVVTPHLVKLLGSNDADTRRIVLDILGKSGAKEAIADIKKLLNDESWSVRAYAGVVLIELGAKDVVPSEVIDDIELLLEWSGEPSERAASALKEIRKLKKKD